MPTRLLPVLCANDSNEMEPNVANDCQNCLAHLCHNLIPNDLMGEALDTVQALADDAGATWKAKESVLDFLQVSRPNMGSHLTLNP